MCMHYASHTVYPYSCLYQRVVLLVLPGNALIFVYIIHPGSDILLEICTTFKMLGVVYALLCVTLVLNVPVKKYMYIT